VESIFADAGNKTGEKAARKALAMLEDEPRRAGELMAAARRLLFAKGDNAHDYKFSSAALEDYYHVSPRWRPYFLASSLVQLRGPNDRDNALTRRTRAALAKSCPHPPARAMPPTGRANAACPVGGPAVNGRARRQSPVHGLFLSFPRRAWERDTLERA